MKADLRWASAVALGILISLPLALAAETYEMKGRDAPAGMVIESFLSTMAEAYTYADEHEFFDIYCEQLRIDPTWPSAKELASASPRIEQAYFESMQEAQRLASGPQELRELERRARLEREAKAGEEFADIYLGLKLDGHPWRFAKFAFMIEARHRSSFTHYSTAPFEHEAVAEQERTFWLAVSEKIETEELERYLQPKRHGVTEAYFRVAREAVLRGARR